MNTEIKEGTRIKFLKTIDEGPDEYGPYQVWASPGQLGTVMHVTAAVKWPFSVCRDDYTICFKVGPDEFEIVTEGTHRDKV